MINISQYFPFLNRARVISREAIDVDLTNDRYVKTISIPLDVEDDTIEKMWEALGEARVNLIRIMPNNIIIYNGVDELQSVVLNYPYKNPTVVRAVVTDVQYGEVAKNIKFSDRNTKALFNRGNNNYESQEIVTTRYIEDAASGLASDIDIKLPVLEMTMRTSNFADEELYESELLEKVVAKRARNTKVKGDQSSKSKEAIDTTKFKEQLDTYFNMGIAYRKYAERLDNGEKPEDISKADTPAKTEKVPLLVGLSGVAKSAIVKDYAQKYGMRLIDVRASFMDRTDIEGISHVIGDDVGEPTATPAPMSEFLTCSDQFLSYARRSAALIREKLSDGVSDQESKAALEKTLKKFEEFSKTPVLFLDEITRADKSIRNVLTILLNQRTYCGRYTVRECRLISATNAVVGFEDEALNDLFIGTGLEDVAVLDRFNRLTVTPETVYDYWIAWAEKNLHPVVVNYIKEDPTRCYNIEPMRKFVNLESDQRTDDLKPPHPTFRAWENVSNYLKKIDVDPEFPKGYNQDIIKGFLGISLDYGNDAEYFINYIRNLGYWEKYEDVNPADAKSNGGVTKSSLIGGYFDKYAKFSAHKNSKEMKNADPKGYEEFLKIMEELISNGKKIEQGTPEFDELKKKIGGNIIVAAGYAQILNNILDNEDLDAFEEAESEEDNSQVASSASAPSEELVRYRIKRQLIYWAMTETWLTTPEEGLIQDPFVKGLVDIISSIQFDANDSENDIYNRIISAVPASYWKKPIFGDEKSAKGYMKDIAEKLLDPNCDILSLNDEMEGNDSESWISAFDFMTSEKDIDSAILTKIVLSMFHLNIDPNYDYTVHNDYFDIMQVPVWFSKFLEEFDIEGKSDSELESRVKKAWEAEQEFENPLMLSIICKSIVMYKNIKTGSMTAAEASALNKQGATVDPNAVIPEPPKPVIHDKMREFLYDSLDADVPCMMVGVSGAGKTTRVLEYCEERGYACEVISLGTMERFDMLGSPWDVSIESHICGKELTETVEKTGIFEDLAKIRDSLGLFPNTTVHASDANLKAKLQSIQESGTPLVVFIDEFNRCSDPVLQSAVFEIISDNRIRGVQFNKGQLKVVLAGNLSDTTGDAMDVDGALIARCSQFKKMEYDENDATCTFEYMKNHGYAQSLIDFFDNAPDKEAKLLDLLRSVDEGTLTSNTSSTRSIKELSTFLKESKSSKKMHGAMLCTDANLKETFAQVGSADYMVAKEMVNVIASHLSNWAARVPEATYPGDKTAGSMEVAIKDFLEVLVPAMNDPDMEDEYTDSSTEAHELFVEAVDMASTLLAVDNVIADYRRDVFSTYVDEDFAQEFAEFYNERSGIDDESVTIDDLVDVSKISGFVKTVAQNMDPLEPKWHLTVIDIHKKFGKNETFNAEFYIKVMSEFIKRDQSQAISQNEMKGVIAYEPLEDIVLEYENKTIGTNAQSKFMEFINSLGYSAKDFGRVQTPGNGKLPKGVI